MIIWCSESSNSFRKMGGSRDIHVAASPFVFPGKEMLSALMSWNSPRATTWCTLVSTSCVVCNLVCRSGYEGMPSLDEGNWDVALMRNIGDANRFVPRWRFAFLRLAVRESIARRVAELCFAGDCGDV